jgi:MYXO-CTERM domain-containing protein
VGSDVAVIGADYIEGPLRFNAYDGSYALDLTGVRNSGNSGTGNGIFQEVATIVGQQYNLSFQVGRMLSVPTDSRYNTTSTVGVNIDGGTPTSFTTDVLTSMTGAANRVNYQLFNYLFVATSTTTRITFRNGTPPLPNGSNYVGLDDVQLTAVPEPATIVSGGIAGLIGLGLAWRRRRKARTG